mgnify:CR=1 FL=1
MVLRDISNAFPSIQRYVLTFIGEGVISDLYRAALLRTVELRVSVIRDREHEVWLQPQTGILAAHSVAPEFFNRAIWVPCCARPTAISRQDQLLIVISPFPKCLLRCLFLFM